MKVFEGNVLSAVLASESSGLHGYGERPRGYLLLHDQYGKQHTRIPNFHACLLEQLTFLLSDVISGLDGDFITASERMYLSSITRRSEKTLVPAIECSRHVEIRLQNC